MTPSEKRFALIGVAILAVAGAGSYMATRFAMHHGPTLSTYGNEVGGSFRLMDATTGTMTDQTFRGRWMLVLFGATHCAQDACEPALRNMSAALDKVDPGKRKAVIIFVSLDPDRDDADRLRQYGAAIGPRVVAGTAAPRSLEALTQEYHAKIEKVDDPEWQYTMRMSPRFVVMDPDTRYKGTVDANQSADEMAEHLATIMKPQE
ncbi:SCO family protein [Acetobacter tropicalis]|uniref:Cytochrome oxidase biogenesis protein Sco1/SenC/PrrC, putative copper metallochaperone n=1 Tax=Acetobacter tropicalis TaxID=104102 RepID=A0A094ZLU3_9PROT|nr:SCO family protein [Acetobacter tropicalis]KAA8385529.1 SCO family protein [Acetobacter tropicalis]KAA8387142.1 SCO family protein [Acetobacter tropicalis]KGB23296.1 Cytochrome oxidase biogenesis protein Sco1/SenC/PrrC, putative copper metallochaperone [Acetobacter tropicalis]MBC9007912.1 SCO family protein [Acetobacter tropicalis]MDO8171012.1 SCO family protein [Acetobacter tropicalis]